MREIKFRGKRIDTGKWLYGYLIGSDVIVGEIVEFSGEYFYTEFWWLVDPKTVGQYTGLDDKNGREIYVGDILEEIGTDVYRYIVHWNVTNATYDFVDIITDETFHGDDIHFEKSEVIGNIYENPDLVGDQDGH